MKGRVQYLGRVVVAVVIAASVGSGLHAQTPGGYENLHVLPPDISRSGLIDVMFENQIGLGLPRRANEGCLFCHVGSMSEPSSQWDWASDDNPMKGKARAMMAMVEDINDRWLPGVDGTNGMEVTCLTCHAGRTNPLPLGEVLLARHEEAGIDGLVETYRGLRTRYYAADAYDFRVPVLASVASQLENVGSTAAAIRVHELNIESNDAPSARHGLIHLRLRMALASDGIDGMLRRYEQEKRVHPVTAFTPTLLSPLAWTLFRDGQEDAGFRLFELNYAEHPDTYTATEDLVWGNAATGDLERAIDLAEAWIDRHPEHALGQRLLADLRASGGLGIDG